MQVQYYMGGQEQSKNNTTLKKVNEFQDSHEYGQSFEQLNETQKLDNTAIPKDLGIQVFNTIQSEMIEKQNVKTFDPNALLEFWKFLVQRYKHYDYKKDNDRSVKKTQLHNIANKKKADIYYTLSIYSEQAKKEYENKKQAEYQKFYNQEPEKQKAKFDSESLKRLYPDFKAETEFNFTAQLIELFKHPHNQKQFINSKILLDFWDKLDKKNQYKQFAMNQQQAEQTINYFLQQRGEILQNEYLLRYKVRAAQTKDKKYESQDLLKFWEKQLRQEFKQRNYLDLTKDSIIELIKQNNINFEKKQNEEQEQVEKQQKEEQEKQEKKKQAKIEKQKKLDLVNGKEEPKVGMERIQELAQCKDNIKVGKQLLKLKGMFKNDAILGKMIVGEFQDGDVKLVKYPYEYDNYDSDEEEKIKGTYSKEPRLINRLLTAYEIQRPGREKQKELVELFKTIIDEFCIKKHKQLKDDVIKQKQRNDEIKFIIQIQDNLINIFFYKPKNLQNQEKKDLFKKFQHQINFYLIYLKNANVILELIPSKNLNIEHTENQKNQNVKNINIKLILEKSFPMSFKRHFFSIVRQIIKSKEQLKQNPKLPFWAPSSGIKICRIHTEHQQCPLDCKYKTLNQKVLNLSKNLKTHKQIMKEREIFQDNVWAMNEYLQERLNVMMTFNDAQECTFRPFINKQKKKIEKCDQWVENLGENFSKRFPMLFKYGIFRRSYHFYLNKQYHKAYSKLLENFNLNQIKQEFDLSYQVKNDIILDPESMYYYQHLGMELDKIPKNFENLKNKIHYNFYHDVFDFVMVLENKCYEIRKSKKMAQKMLSLELQTNSNEDDNAYDKRRNQIKKFMCPLKDQCPEIVTQRWPYSQNKTTTIIGSNCPYAHHLYELKFQQEKNLKKKMLQNVIDNYEHSKHADEHKIDFFPGGRSLVSCIGCSQQTMCSFCELRKMALKKIEQYREKAKKRHFEIISSNHFSQKVKEDSEYDKNLNLKMGYLNTANTLYQKERYQSAFDAIIKAVELVKQEKQKDQESQLKYKNKLKKEIGLDDELSNLTKAGVYQKQEEFFQKKIDNDKDYKQGISQKMTLFNIKMGVIGDEKIDVNSFINYQIEIIYRKIESRLITEVENTDIMKNRIEKLKKLQDKDGKIQEDSPKNKLCQQWLEAKTNNKQHAFDKCDGIHSSVHLEMVSQEQKLKNLEKAVEQYEKKIRQSKPPIEWQPSSVGSHILPLDKQYAKDEHIKLLKSDPNIDNKEKDFYDKNNEILFKSPIDRK